MAARQERIDAFIHEGSPPTDQPLEILCEEVKRSQQDHAVMRANTPGRSELGAVTRTNNGASAPRSAMPRKRSSVVGSAQCKSSIASTIVCVRAAANVPHLARLASIGLLTQVVEDFAKPIQPETSISLTVAFWHPVVRQAKRGGGVLDSLGFVGGSRGFRHDTYIV
jgi:hypothetical protein